MKKTKIIPTNSKGFSLEDPRFSTKYIKEPIYSRQDLDEMDRQLRLLLATPPPSPPKSAPENDSKDDSPNYETTSPIDEGVLINLDDWQIIDSI